MTERQRRRWLKRAETIQRRAYALQAEMIGVLGVEDTLTDWGDNLVIAAEEMTEALDHPKTKLQARKK